MRISITRGNLYPYHPIPPYPHRADEGAKIDEVLAELKDCSCTGKAQAPALAPTLVEARAPAQELAGQDPFREQYTTSEELGADAEPSNKRHKRGGSSGSSSNGSSGSTKTVPRSPPSTRTQICPDDDLDRDPTTGDCEKKILQMINIVGGEGGSEAKLDAVKATLQWEGRIPVKIPGVGEFQFTAHEIRRVCETCGIDAWLSDLYYLIPKHQVDARKISEVWQKEGVVLILQDPVANSAKQGEYTPQKSQRWAERIMAVPGMGTGTPVMVVHMHNARGHWTVRVLAVASGWSSCSLLNFDPYIRTGPSPAELNVDERALLQCMAQEKKIPFPSVVTNHVSFLDQFPNPDRGTPNPFSMLATLCVQQDAKDFWNCGVCSVLMVQHILALIHVQRVCAPHDDRLELLERLLDAMRHYRSDLMAGAG